MFRRRCGWPPSPSETGANFSNDRHPKELGDSRNFHENSGCPRSELDSKVKTRNQGMISIRSLAFTSTRLSPTLDSAANVLQLVINFNYESLLHPSPPNPSSPLAHWDSIFELVTSTTRYARLMNNLTCELFMARKLAINQALIVYPIRKRIKTDAFRALIVETSGHVLGTSTFM